MIGESVGPYRVLEKLGAGGMGEVYRARDTRLDRDVAIEVSGDRRFVHYTDQGRKPPREAMPIAREHARRAIALDPASPDAHHWLARIAAQYDYNWPDALRHYERAAASGRLSPNARGALVQFVLLPLGRDDEAERETEAGVAADPLSPLRDSAAGRCMLDALGIPR